MSAPARLDVAPGAQPLALAARALDLVVSRGVTAEAALLSLSIPPADRAAVRAIHTGALRFYPRLSPLAGALLQPGQQVASPVHALLVCALHQLEYSRAAAHSAVNIAVDAARVLRAGAAAGFVNALLRRFLRERAELVARIDADPATAAAHPRWLHKLLRETHPARLPQLIAANNESPALVLRVNTLRTTRAAWLEKLAEQGIAASPGLAPTSIVLDEASEVSAVPGFDEGMVSVQDAGAQFAAELLDAQPGHRVLDACAAPGGKSCHLLERTPGIELTALDVDAGRLDRVRQNLSRLGLTAQVIACDAADAAAATWNSQPFHRILIDAPCSGTGVIRRHPDIKLLRRPGDIAGFVAQQRRLLRRCAALLAPGGRLLYATCSVLPAENQQLIGEFLAEHPAFSRARADLVLLPTPRSTGAAALTDGFYYACLDMKMEGA
ncbi:MAG: 16S rRNA (cytosine(967)-C(5))-methyltransferase RsmB [Steroidobacteraceae bacterium]